MKLVFSKLILTLLLSVVYYEGVDLGTGWMTSADDAAFAAGFALILATNFWCAIILYQIWKREVATCVKSVLQLFS